MEFAELLIPTSYKNERGFAQKLGIPWSTYQKDKHTLKVDRFSMPESRLYKYAKAYDVRMEDLLNYKINIKCIRDNYLTDCERITLKFGLS